MEPIIFGTGFVAAAAAALLCFASLGLLASRVRQLLTPSLHPQMATNLESSLRISLLIAQPFSKIHESCSWCEFVLEVC